MEFVKLEGNRSGYTPEQCTDTLTVGALIEVLSQFDEDMLVYLKNDDGYTYGHIDRDEIWTEEYEPEDEG